MVVQVNLTVVPGPPDVPDEVLLVITGLVPATDVEIVVNGQVRRTLTADGGGNVSGTYNVPNGGPIPAALADFAGATSSFKDDPPITLLFTDAGLGDTIEIRTA